MDEQVNGTTALFLNHRVQACGVHQFGRTFHEYVEGSAVKLVYREADGPTDFRRCLGERPWDLVVVNFHHDTMVWLTPSLLKSVPAPVVGIAHEFDDESCHLVDANRFRYRILCDPTVDSRVPGVFVLPRVAPPFPEPSEAVGRSVVVGSFGLGTPGKGFERVVLLARREFDEVLVRLHIPPSHFADPNGVLAREIGERCRSLGRRVGVEVQVTHDLKDRSALLEFLAGNSINVFMYEQRRGRGVSSAIDLAVAAGRPIATSDSNMFRALLAGAPGCALETRTLRDILGAGPAEVLALKREWTPSRFRNAFERAISQILELERARAAGAVKFNCVLDDNERARYARTIDQLKELAPQTMARKIERANVQQAFVRDAVEFFTGRDKAARILCVGAFEDTASQALTRLGYDVEEIDPALNFTLAEFFRRPTTAPGTYDVVFSTSVIEHVSDDEEFIEHIARLLRPGGVAILTMDFKPGFKPGDPKPLVDERLYTVEDLLGRLLLVHPECELVDVPDWQWAEPDFEYDGVAYCFATFTFRKRRGVREPRAHLARLLAENALLRRRIARLEADSAAPPSSLSERLIRRLLRLARSVRH